MANVKELIEQRNALFEESDKILNSVEKEKRSVSDSEAKKLNSIKDEIRSLNESIEYIENKKGKKMEERGMNNEVKLEQRTAVSQFLRRQEGEQRAQYVNSTSDGKAIIPVTVTNEIIDKMESFSNIFGTARRYNSVAGELRIPRENSTDMAGFVGENQEVPSIRLKFDFVKLVQRRVGAAITLTNQLVNDTSFDVVDFAVSKLASQTARAVELSALKGQSDNDEFEGLLSPKTLALPNLNKVALSDTVTVDDLIDIYNTIQPAYLDGSQWIMSRALFSEITKLEDGNGHKYIQGGVVNGRLQQTLLGLPVVVSDQLTAKDGIIFGSVKDAYAIMVKDDFTLQYVTGDTQQATNGTQLLVFDGYMDGNVINPEAIVIAQPGLATTTTTTTSTPEG